MGWISARQPNGKICILSTVVDGIIYDNLTDEEYINVMVERAKENAKAESERHLKRIQENGDNFEQIKDGFYPDDEDGIERIREWLKSVGDPDWRNYNYDLPKY